jgi:hypothetical protein
VWALGFTESDVAVLHDEEFSVAALAWTWRFESSTGEPVRVLDAAEASFTSQGDAESWIGETWQQLAEMGVEQVTLLEGEREVYGPMSLSPSAE